MGDDSVSARPSTSWDMVEGRIFWDPTLPGMTLFDRSRVPDAMNAAIASLHGIYPAATGLGDFGRPGNYFRTPDRALDAAVLRR